MKQSIVRARALVLAGLLGLVWFVSNAEATASTHVWAPSTDVQRFNSLHVTYDLYVPVENDASGTRLPSVTNLGLTWGALPLQKLNLEVGMDHKSGYGALDLHPFYFNGKFGIPEGGFSGYSPALAMGIFDVGTKKGATDYNVVYAKLAKTLGPIGRASIGYFGGNSDLLLDADGTKDNTGIMAAWERTMPEISDRLWLCVDYMGTNSSYGALSFGASWKFTNNMAVLAGYDAYNESRLFPSTFTIQADVDFDIGRRGDR